VPPPRQEIEAVVAALGDLARVLQRADAALRWNDAGKWLWSDKIVQPPVIDRDIFDQVQVMSETC
jgi:hypothetical protein